MTRAYSLLILMIGVILSRPAAAEQFIFVALGDTAYNLPADIPRYELLIDTINASEPAFTIHVGDTWGALVCTEESHRRILEWFQRYDHPLIYTPGDNEWTDCRKPEIIDAYIKIITGKATPADQKLIGDAYQLDNAIAGTSFADTIASLKTIRKVFFSEARSLGKQTIPLVRQSDVSVFTQMAENVRWEKSGVIFATISVPGSGMNFTINDPVRAQEAINRNKADVEWIKATFSEATEKNASAVVIALHASLFVDGDGGEFSNRRLRGGQEGPYFWIALAIRDLAEKFAKPVLVINGDFHDLIIDRPFLLSQGESRPPKHDNITRLQVYGAPELKAVTISVDTQTPWIFSFSPLY